MVSGDPLLKAIKIMGSRQEMIKMLGISGQRLNAWLNGNVAMGYEYALALEHLTGGRVTAHELAPEKSQLLKKLKINLSQPLTWLIRKQMLVKNIHISERPNSQLDEVKNLAANIEKEGLLRPIVMDTNHRLIAGERRLCAYQLLRRHTIPAFVLSLEILLKDPDANYLLKKYFTISERVAIGIALEIVLGKRQGQRTDLRLLQNFAGLDPL